MTRPVLYTDLKTERVELRQRYLHGLCVGAANATLTLSALLIRYGWEDVTPFIVFGLWIFVLVLTFGVSLVFWRKKARTRKMMILFGALSVLGSYIAIFGFSLLYNHYMGLGGIYYVIEELALLHVETWFAGYLPALILSPLFASKDADPRESF